MAETHHRVPDDVLTFCERAVPRLIQSFVIEARDRQLPLAGISVITPPEPEFSPDMQEVGFRLSFGWQYTMMTAPPMHNEERVRTASGWSLCSIETPSGSILEKWFVSTDGELRQVVGREIPAWPLEFYAHLSAAVQGGYDQPLLPLDEGSALVHDIFDRALKGQPPVVTIASAPG